MNFKSNGMTSGAGRMVGYSRNLVKGAKPVKWEKVKSAGPMAKWAKRAGPGAKWARKPGIGKMKSTDVWWM